MGGDAPANVGLSDEKVKSPTGSATQNLSNEDVPMAQADTPDVPMRFNEKKRLHWQGLTCTILNVLYNFLS